LPNVLASYGTLVTWNGHCFDLPVLRYRAMVNRVSAEDPGAAIFSPLHGGRVCDVLGSYLPGGKVKQDEVTKIFGLPGKPEGIHGSCVEEMVRLGQIDEVVRYCETDVLTAYRVWLVYELFRAAITADQLAWSEGQVRDFVANRKAVNRIWVRPVGWLYSI
jgi:3'-5' exonuclease